MIILKKRDTNGKRLLLHSIKGLQGMISNTSLAVPLRTSRTSGSSLEVRM